jgi:hypothetical protein
MDITTFGTPVAPPAANTEPGDLYCDLQSRTLWLGVEEAVDPAGAVLISDLANTLAAIDDALATANAYTDAKLVPYALKASPVFTGIPRAPTAAVANNTDQLATTAFVKAALAANTGDFVVGMIIMWYGDTSIIPAGWHLCDGSTVNGQTTPDLRNRFVIGAGGAGFKGPGTKNANTSVSTDNDGAFAPVIRSFTLTTDHLPAHAHGQQGSFNTNNGGVNHSHSFSDTSDGGTSHAHTVAVRQEAQQGGPDNSRLQLSNDNGVATSFSIPGPGSHTHVVSGTTGTASAVSHTHPFSISGNTTSIGKSVGHTHGSDPLPSHNHAIKTADLTEATSYMALCYIMKV